MGELDVGAADDLDRIHDPVGVVLKTLLQLFGNGQHRRGAEGVAGVGAHRVDVLDEADGDHIAVRVTDNLQLQFLPAQDRFLYQNLSHEAGLQA